MPTYYEPNKDSPRSIADIAVYLSIANPVVGMLFFRGNVAMVKRGKGPMATRIRGDRKKIYYLSKRARARLAFVALATPIEFKSLITLTYPAAAPIDGQQVKHQLKLFLKSFNKAYSDSYLWVIEFQARGAPHFHLTVTTDSINYADRVWLAQTWLRCIGFGEIPFRRSGLDGDELIEANKVLRVHSHERAWEPIREKDGARHYMVKEALKMRQKIVPQNYSDVGRFWGCSLDVTRMIEPIREISCDEQTARDMLESFGSKAYSLEILPKIIWAVETD